MPAGEEEEQEIENLLAQIMKEILPNLEKEIDNLSNAEFKTLVIRMLTELIELGHKMKEEMKPIQSKIKEKYREPTVKGRKLGLKSMIWSRRKK